ncbi:MAG: IclR family transcriptional regulator, acetate operon repressor [Solirubrobacteraceae bacterium]|jgi:DNA-binding IclR family transcriptional regulator|nr:IclR family transcriptional regulator, acetate operon repressor [Solirubrobacteraceae bacterium]
MATPVASNPVDRSAHLLSLVLERSPRAPAELAAALGVGPVELEPLVAALERHGLLQWDGEHALLRPGPGPLRFARSGLGREDLVHLAGPGLRRLADESGETANLMVPTPGGTEAIAQEAGRHLLGATNWIGRDIPDHASAAGKVFLAHGAAGVPARLQAFTSRTIVDRPALEADLAAVRDRGYATLVDELEDGLAVVAAPVFDAGGRVVAALAVSGPTARLPGHRLALLGRVTIEQAHALSVRLGYAGALEDPL